MSKEVQKAEKAVTKPNHLAALRKTVKSVHYPTGVQTRQAFILVISCIVAISVYLYLVDTGIAKLIELFAKLF